MRFFRKRKKKSEQNPLERITLRYKGFITIPELAWVLRVSIQTVHNWVGNRWDKRWKLEGFPPILVRGKRLVFQISEVEEFFDIKIGREFAQPLLSCKDIERITEYSEPSVRMWLTEARTRKIGKVLIRIERKELEGYLAKKYGWNPDREYHEIPATSVLALKNKKEERRKNFAF